MPDVLKSTTTTPGELCVVILLTTATQTLPATCSDLGNILANKWSSHIMPLLTTKLSLLQRTPQTPNAFSGPDAPELPMPVGDLARITHGSLDQDETLQTAPWAIFAGLADVSNDRHRTRNFVCCNRPHPATAAMRPKTNDCQRRLLHNHSHIIYSKDCPVSAT